MIPINYRSVLIEGRLEASYPSSTTLLVLSVMPTLMFQAQRRGQLPLIRKAAAIFVIAFSGFMVIGRLISGVHWATDIIGSVVLSAGLFLLYRAVVFYSDKKIRIKIYPASQEQMEKAIALETDEELKKAYEEMLEGCLTHPGERDWYAMWMIEKPDGTQIGDLCFKGIEKGLHPEIGYGILEEYRGQGFATEAVKQALKWAFRHPEVKAVEAEADSDNAASQRVLMKCGFRPKGETGKEGPRYIVYLEEMR